MFWETLNHSSQRTVEALCVGLWRESLNTENKQAASILRDTLSAW